MTVKELKKTLEDMDDDAIIITRSGDAATLGLCL